MMIDALFLDQVDKKRQFRNKEPSNFEKKKEKRGWWNIDLHFQESLSMSAALKNEMNNVIWLNFQKLYDEE